MYKQQKQRLQICVTLEDLAFIEHFGERTGAKNASEAIHELIFEHKTMQTSIDKFKERVMAAQKEKSYEQVRNEQIKNEHEKPGLTTDKDPRKDSKWAFLGKPIDPNEKSRIDDKRFKPTKKK